MSLLQLLDSSRKHILLIVTNGNYACCQDYFCDECALMFVKVLHRQNQKVITTKILCRGFDRSCLGSILLLLSLLHISKHLIVYVSQQGQGVQQPKMTHFVLYRIVHLDSLSFAVLLCVHRFLSVFPLKGKNKVIDASGNYFKIFLCN